MKISCKINGKDTVFNTYADKPLVLLLVEDSEITSLSPGCGKGICGNCVVLLNNHPVLSCMIPAFKIRDKEITTYEGYTKTRFYNDVARGYEEAGATPCSYCIASKTLLIESVIQENSAPEIDDILDMLSINKCSCIDEKDLVKVVESAVKYRRRRRVRRS